MQGGLGRWVYLAHDRDHNAIWITIDLEKYIRRIELRAMQREVCVIRSDRKLNHDEWIDWHFSAPSWGTEFITQVREHMNALAVGAAISENPQRFLENPIVFLSAIGWEAEIESENIYEQQED